MSDNEEFQGPEAPYTITLKGGSGYEKPWLVLRAASAEDAIALLAEAEMNELPGKIAEFAASFQEKTGAAAPSAGAQGGASSSARAAGSRGSSQSSRGAAAPSTGNSDVEYHPEGLTCSKAGCGAPVIYKKITAGSGKKYELWVCENQRTKGDGHFTEFIN